MSYERISSLSFIIPLTILLTACFDLASAPVGIEVEYRPIGIPLKVSINSFGEVTFASDDMIVIPTEIGVFEVGLLFEPTRYVDAENVLIVRTDDYERVFDLHGQDFRVEFESDYYSEISIESIDEGSLLLVVSQKSGAEPVNLSRRSLSLDCPEARGPSFEIGDRFTVPYGGEGPTALWDGPNQEPAVGSMADGTGGVILDGPICVQGKEGMLLSWYVESDSGTRGWVSEGYTHNDGAWIVPKN